MITLPHRPTEKPDRLQGRKVGYKKAALTRKFRSGTPIDSKDFDRDFYSHLEIRRPLWIWQAKKCCYCERRRDLTREPDVEHFRPKTQIAGVGPGYWWLAYEWTNLFFCCKTCNQGFKKTEFPLEAGGVRALPGNLDFQNERPTLADLTDENDSPEQLIGYFWIREPEPLAKPVGLDAAGRGARIIKILGLDRDELNQERGALIHSLLGWQEEILLAIANGNELARNRAAERIRQNTTRSQTFVGFRRFFLRQLMLGEYLAAD